MFSKEIYRKRRRVLKDSIDSGLILFLGNDESPMNASDNCYPFRQEYSFIYYFGCDSTAGLAGIIDVDKDEDYLFGDDVTIDDQIWMGAQPLIQDLGFKSGISNSAEYSQLKPMISKAIASGRKVHFLPVCRADIKLKLEELTGIHHSKIANSTSFELIKAVVNQRSVKEDFEIEEMEKAIDISHQMYSLLLREIKPGVKEEYLLGKIMGLMFSQGSKVSFPAILSRNGKTLHNHTYSNILSVGDLLLIDSGVKSSEYYSSDITRTYPVSGKFTPRQKAVYDIVLNSQLKAISEIKPGILYRDIHFKVAEVMVEGLISLGIMKGNVQDAVREGAHALFYPHGLGHMIGLDVHDMEVLGEDNVGYDEEISRSSIFGLSALRMAKRLQKGFVVTAEPGIYFIPRLIDLWKSQNKFTDFINYNEVETYKYFEGIRIEDDILVTETGSRVLGKPIPKSVNDIESIMSSFK